MSTLIWNLDEFSSIVNVNRKCVLLTDSNTKLYCLPLIRQHLNPETIYLNIPSGEEYKNFNMVEYLITEMLSYEIDRNSLFITLGGGIITDLGGFTASIYKRGIQLIHIPTTLLAMADASIGGKNAIDVNNIKNAVGNIYQASHVFIHPVFINSLSPQQIQSGRAEMVKHGIISDANHFDKVTEINWNSTEILLDLIKESIYIKENITTQDLYETGIRKWLNFGHTLGHAYESYWLQNEIKIEHGIAIAWGMYFEVNLAILWKIIDTEKANYIKYHLDVLYKIRSMEFLDLEKIYPFLVQDKKNMENKISFSLPLGLGNGIKIKHVSLAELNLVWNEIKTF